LLKDVELNVHVDVEKVVPFRTEVFQIPLLLLQSLFGGILTAVLMEGIYASNLLSAFLPIVWAVELYPKVGDGFKP
jgi:hypothetical protein